jgi:hypothetical protein
LAGNELVSGHLPDKPVDFVGGYTGVR